MKIILDCNVLIGAGTKPGGVCHQVVREILLNHQVFVCREILDEYNATLNKTRLRKHKEAIKIILGRILCVAESVKPVERPFKLIDPDDEIYLAAAVTAEADILITGDEAHFPEPRYGVIRVLRPHEFLSMYEER